jgi:hypothetical protein
VSIVMIFLVIAVAWIAIATLCCSVCVLAARGDGRGAEARAAETGVAEIRPAETVAAGRRRKGPDREGLVVWEGLPELRVKDATPVAP